MLSLGTTPVYLSRTAGFNCAPWGTRALQSDSALCAGGSYRLERSAKNLITTQSLQRKLRPLQYYTFLGAVIKQSHSSGECRL